MKIAIVISANAEWAAVKPVYPNVRIEHYAYGECFQMVLDDMPITYFHTGWGKTASAGALQHILDVYSPDLVINLGTCGGFDGVVQQGNVILVERTFVYDIVELMETVSVSDYYASALDLSWLAEPDFFLVRRGFIASPDIVLLPIQIPSF